MIPFFVNITLALLWGVMTANMGAANLAVGFVFGGFALWLVRDRFGAGAFRRFGRILGLFGTFFKELALSSVRVAWDTIQPQMSFTPGIIAVPLDIRQDFEIALLANLISLTPGTLSVDVSDDKTCLYVHAMDVENPDELIHSIKDVFERRIAEAFG